MGPPLHHPLSQPSGTKRYHVERYSTPNVIPQVKRVKDNLLSTKEW